MKTFFASLVALFAIVFLSHAAGTMPIKNGVLQSDLNAGGHSLTNVTDVTDANGNSLIGGGPGGGISAIQASNIVNGSSGVIQTNGAAWGTTFQFSDAGTNIIDARATAAAASMANLTAQWLADSNALYQQSFDVNVLLNGCVGDGVTDDTTALQAILNRGGYIRMPAKVYKITGPLWVTNNTVIYGYGARLDLDPSLTATRLLNVATNANDIAIFGLTVNGGNSADCYSVTRSTNTLRTAAAPYINSRIYFRDMRFWGWDTALNVLPWTDSSSVMMLPHFQFSGCEFSTNAYSVVAQTPDNTGNVVAEYLHVTGNNFHDNSYGVWAGAGNVYVNNNMMDHNRVMVQVDGTVSSQNPGHGEIAINSMNHAGIDFVVVNNCVKGETICDNLFYGGSAIGIVNSAQVSIRGNSFGPGCVVSSTGTAGGTTGPNYVSDNTFLGKFGVSSTGFIVFDFTANSDTSTNFAHWNNISMDNRGFDDPYRWNPFNTNQTDGSVFTNLNASQLSSGTIPMSVLNTNVVTATNQPWTPGQALVVTGTNSTGQPVVKGTNWPSGGGGGSGTVTSVDVAEAGHSSSGAVTTSGTVTLARNGDENFLNHGATNISTVGIGVWQAFTNTVGLTVTNPVTGGSITLSNGVLLINNYAAATTNQLLNATGLGASHHVGTDANTNLINQEDFTGMINSVSYTNYLATTNIVAVFDGNNHSGTVTNGPDVWITPSVAGNSSGSWSFEFLTNVNIHLPYSVRWLAGSNGISANVFSITNGEFDLTAYGSTNFPHLKAAIGENQ